MAWPSFTVRVARARAKEVEKMGCTQEPGVQQYIREIMARAKAKTPVRPGTRANDIFHHAPNQGSDGAILIRWALSS